MSRSIEALFWAGCLFCILAFSLVAHADPFGSGQATDGPISAVSSGGGGGLSGPVSSTDNAVSRFNGVGGDTLDDSGVLIDDSDNVSGVADLTVTGTTTLETSLSGPLKASSGVVSASDVNLSSEVTGTLPVANGGTNSSTALNNDRAMISSGGAIVESVVTSTELGYLDGVTSALQTQINGKAPSDGDGIKDHICGHIETPDDKAYYLVANAFYPFTINSIVTDVDSGTASGALEVEGTPVTGCTSSDISISSTEATDTCTAGNTVTVGETVELVVSSNSSSDDLRFCVEITRD